LALTEILDRTADVLVVGGGPAATWAALTAAREGADVVLADKGYCGTSGATASAGTGVWYVAPDPAQREAAIASREKLGGYLADRRWAVRVLDETYETAQRAGRHRAVPVSGGRGR
jgi:succinate dehydrogenase/fumarate reductase flavoprotein subunit